MDLYREVASPGQLARLGGRGGTSASPPRCILILGGHFMPADILVLALTHVRYSARCIAPVTPERVRLAITDWAPALAVLDIDFVERHVCQESIALLSQSKVPVIVLGGKKELLADCVNFGASYAIDNGLPVSKLIDVIARLAHNHSLNNVTVVPDQSSPVNGRLGPLDERSSPFDVLTHREKCVLAELMEGHCAEEIAVRDVVAISTVRSQIKAILQKLGVSSQLAATALARHAGWTFNERVGPSQRGPF